MGSEDGEHVIEAIGRCRIVIREGVVAEVGDPLIRDCPLARRFGYPIPSISREHVVRNIAHRIETFGLCSARRTVAGRKEYVGFGTSEILSDAMDAGLLDAVVLPCDGAGTVVATRPDLVQGIGGRMSGLVKTMPISAVIGRIRSNGGIVVDPVAACLDPEKGVAWAMSSGYRRIAVTVADAGPAERIRRDYPDTCIAAVHLSGISREDAARLAVVADLVTACASGPVREIAGAKALLQAGTAIPVFAMTDRGREIILSKIARGRGQFMVRTARLPVTGDARPYPLV